MHNSWLSQQGQALPYLLQPCLAKTPVALVAVVLSAAGQAGILTRYFSWLCKFCMT